MADTESLVDDDEGEKQTYVKPVRLSLHLIVKRHLSPEAISWPQDQIISELNKIKRVRLDRENIGVIDSLELLSTEVTNLYLQSNRISCIQNLECLPNLQVLILCNNEIKQMEGILHLQKLTFLDISENCVEIVSAEEFPKSIIILNLSGNPCVNNASHRSNLIQSLPKLRQLDGKDISSKEKIEAGVPCEPSDDDESDEYETVEEKEVDDCEVATGYSEKAFPNNLQSGAYKPLPSIETNIQDFATEILVRSQKRLEDSISEHRRHVQEMTNIRMKNKIKPEPGLSKLQ